MPEKNILPQNKSRNFIVSNLGTILIVILMVLLFYPPYFRGLFFSSEMLPSQIITGLLLAVVMAGKFHRREFTFLVHPLDFAVLAYAMAYTLSVTAAASLPEAIKGMLRAIDYLAIYWLVVELIRNRFLVRLALNVLYLSAVGVALVGIGVAIGYIHYPGAVVNGRIYSTLQYPNISAAYLAAVSLLGFTSWQGQTKVYFRMVYAVGNLLLIAVSLSALSKGGWLVLLLGLVLLLAGLPIKHWPRLLFNVVLVVVASIIVSKGLLTAAQGTSSAIWRPLLGGALIVISGELLATGMEIMLARFAQDKANYVKPAIICLILVIIVSGGIIASDHSMRQRVLPQAFVDRLSSFTAEDQSFVTRHDFTAIAWEIVKDHPVLGTGAGGWNALYHRYQDYLYYTTEVHNHFMQVWVEAGTFGFIAFLAMWATLLYTLWLLRRVLAAASGDWLSVWGMGVAALAIGAHSAIDFTLSLPAMCLFLWSLLGLIRASHLMILAESAAGEQRKISGLSLKFRNRIINVTLGLVVALFLLIPSASLYAAERSAKAGAEAFQEKDFKQAADSFARAVQFDPFTASYRLDLAQMTYILNAGKKDKAKIDEIVKQLEKAEQLEPNNLKVQSKLLNLYSEIGRGDKTLIVAERLVQINPLDIGAYEALGKVYVSAGRYFLEQKAEKKARPYFERAYNLPTEIKKKADAVPPDRLKFWVGPKLEVTPEITLLAGQAAYLKEDFPAAVGHLQAALAKPELKQEILPWLAATYQVMGEEGQAAALLGEMGKAGSAAEKEYRRLLSLKGR
ncbi:MAG: hypothetical protein HPY81_04310 [Firmicutes bacterium]|nr:hypothetical protein [Bacillota bacterium]